jgi:hypothetical protein
VLAASQPQAQNLSFVFNFSLCFLMLQGLLSTFVQSLAFGVLNSQALLVYGQRLTWCLAKLGLDNLSFNIFSLSTFVPGWTNFARQLYATSNFNYKFNFSSGRTIGKSPTSLSPGALAAN